MPSSEAVVASTAVKVVVDATVPVPLVDETDVVVAVESKQCVEIEDVCL